MVCRGAGTNPVDCLHVGQAKTDSGFARSGHAISDATARVRGPTSRDGQLGDPRSPGPGPLASWGHRRQEFCPRFGTYWPAF